MCGSPAQPLGQRQTGLWDVVSQSALLPQGLWTIQGSRHWFSMQALLSGQSMSCWHSPLWTIKKKFSLQKAILPKLKRLILTSNTAAVGISCKPRWTSTVGPVVIHGTFCTNSTRIVNTTRVYTCSISASLTGCTFFITWATNLNWCSYEKI